MKSSILDLILLGIVLLVGLLTTSAWARTEVYQDQSYIYFKTPFKELAQSEKRYLIKKTQGLLLQRLKGYIEKNKSLPLFDELDVLKVLQETLDPVLDSIEVLTNPKSIPGLRFLDAVPTAFLLFAGGVFTQGLAVSGGGSVSLGIVVLPSKLSMVDKLTQKVTTYYPLEVELILIPSVNLGVGPVVGGPKARAGVGLIWGPLDEPSDFAGLSMGLSASIQMIHGFHYKVGILRQYTKPRYNVFTMVGYEFGPGASFAPHGNILPIFALDNALSSLFGNMDEVVIPKRTEEEEVELKDLIKKHGNINSIGPSQ